MKCISAQGVTLAMAVLMSIPVASLAEIDMVTGEWEITLGSPSNDNEEIQPSRWQECLTRNAPIPQPDPKQFQKCKIKKQEFSDNTARWHVVCFKGGNKIKGEGDITFHGDNFTGSIKSLAADNNTDASSAMPLAGHRVGPCTGTSNSHPASPNEINKTLTGKKTSLQKARQFWDSTKESPLDQ